jgi:hypothetical protein
MPRGGPGGWRDRLWGLPICPSRTQAIPHEDYPGVYNVGCELPEGHAGSHLGEDRVGRTMAWTNTEGEKFIIHSGEHTWDTKQVLLWLNNDRDSYYAARRSPDPATTRRIFYESYHPEYLRGRTRELDPDQVDWYYVHQQIQADMAEEADHDLEERLAAERRQEAAREPEKPEEPEEE